MSGVHSQGLTMRPAALFESRNASQDVTDKEKLPGEHFKTRNAVDFGLCPHGLRRLYDRCKECAASRAAERRKRYDLAAAAQESAETCGRCGRALASGVAVVIRSMTGITRGRWLVPVCCQCARIRKDASKGHPCDECGRPVILELSARRRRGVFCCGRHRRKWFNHYYNEQRKARIRPHLEKICEVCGEDFTASRVDAKACSPACKQKAYRRRRAS